MHAGGCKVRKKCKRKCDSSFEECFSKPPKNILNSIVTEHAAKIIQIIYQKQPIFDKTFFNKLSKIVRYPRQPSHFSDRLHVINGFPSGRVKVEPGCPSFVEFPSVIRSLWVNFFNVKSHFFDTDKFLL